MKKRLYAILLLPAVSSTMAFAACSSQEGVCRISELKKVEKKEIIKEENAGDSAAASEIELQKNLKPVNKNDVKGEGPSFRSFWQQLFKNGSPE